MKGRLLAVETDFLKAIGDETNVNARRSFFYFPVRWLLCLGVMTGLQGCASVVEVMPSPPGFMVSVDLNGVHDKDIPAVKAAQIKNADIFRNEWVPYIFISVGAGFEAKGDLEKSIHYFNRAILEFHKRSNALGEQTARRWKISALQRFGKSTEALEEIRTMEAQGTQTPFHAFVLYQYGHYYAENGDSAKALDYLARALQANPQYEGNTDLTALRRDTELEYALALMREDYFPALSDGLLSASLDESFYAGIHRSAAASLVHLKRAGELNDNLKQNELARVFPEIVPAYLACDLHNYLGLVYGIQEQADLSKQHLEKGLHIARSAGYFLGEADSLWFLNQISLLARHPSSRPLETDNLDTVADRYHLPAHALWAQVMRAYLFRKAGDMERAADALSGAFKTMTLHDLELSSFSRMRGGVSFQKQAVLETLFDLQILKGDHREAFRTAERIKALSFAAVCREDGVRIGQTPQDEISPLRIYRGTMAHDYRRLLSPVNTPSVFLEMIESIRKTQTALQGALTSAEKQNKTFSPLMCNDPPDADTLQKSLESNTTLFSYYCAKQSVYIWVIHTKGVHLASRAASRADAERLVRDYHLALASGDKNRLDAVSEKAYDLLVKPVIPYVHGDRLLIIPHGPLESLPFSSMRYMNAYLVDGFSISYLTHAGMMTGYPADGWGSEMKPWLTLTEKRTGKTHPRISKAYHSILLNASREDILKLTGRYSLIDFDLACYISDGQPQDSGFLTASTASDPEYLRGADLLALSLKGRLAVLHACRSEKGAFATQAGYATVTGPLLASAAPHVLIPLWATDEKQRALFLQGLYQSLEKNENVADALRAAQNEMIQAGVGPLEWAAYILLGPP